MEITQNCAKSPTLAGSPRLNGANLMTHKWYNTYIN